MPSPPTPYYSAGDIIEVTSVNHFNNQLGLCVWHYHVDSIGGTGADVDDAEIAKDVDNVFGSFFRACMGPSVSHRGMKARRISPDITPGGINASAQGNGTFESATGGGPVLPKQVSGVISLLTALASRSGKGRKYVPFPSQIANDTDETPSNAYMIALIQLAAEFPLQRIVTSNLGATVTMRPIVFQRLTPGASAFLTGAIARDRWGTQRRRGDYGRTNVAPF